MVPPSAGNHAQGVALASGLLGAKATVFMPVGAPLPKIEATRSYGAEVILTGHTVDAGLDAVRVSLNSAVKDLYEAYYQGPKAG